MKPVHLRRMRRRRLMTQKQLSELSGIAQNTISRLETEPKNPAFDTVVHLAKALKVDPTLLRFGPEPGTARRARARTERRAAAAEL